MGKIVIATETLQGSHLRTNASKLVWFCLMRGVGDGGIVRTSALSISKEIGVCEKTVRNALKSFSEIGVIEYVSPIESPIESLKKVRYAGCAIKLNDIELYTDSKKTKVRKKSDIKSDRKSDIKLLKKSMPEELSGGTDQCENDAFYIEPTDGPHQSHTEQDPDIEYVDAEEVMPGDGNDAAAGIAHASASAKIPGKSKKGVTLVTRARMVFENHYREMFGEAYYWTAKDGAHMKQLLAKIKHSRTNRENPMPVDDDSLMDALSSFLTAIDNGWILDHFSVSNIDSQYNNIKSQLNKKNRNGTQTNFRHTAAEQNRAAAENAIRAIYAKAEKRKGNGTGQDVEQGTVP